MRRRGEPATMVCDDGERRCNSRSGPAHRGRAPRARVLASPVIPGDGHVPGQPLSERAYARLRHTLIVGQVRPGQQLTLAKLAERLGTSATPVRDALSRLTAADAVQQSRERGVIIPVLSSIELHELRRLRLTLEPLAFTTTAPAHRKADWRLFKVLHSEIVNEAQAGDPVRFATAVRHLRVALLGLALPSVMAMFIDQIWCRLGPSFTQRAAKAGFRHNHAALLGDVARAIGEQDLQSAQAALVAEIEADDLYQDEAGADLRAPPLVPSPHAAERPSIVRASGQIMSTRGASV